MIDINTILIKIFSPSIWTFVIGILISGPLIKWMTINEIWKKKSVEKTTDGREAVLTSKLHNDEEKKLLRMGGMVIYLSVLAVMLIFWILARILGDNWAILDFVSRKETWIPVFTFIVGGILGAIDDLLVVGYFGKSVGGYVGGGLSLSKRFLVVIPLSIFIAYWFVFKLGMDSVLLPFYGEIVLPISFMFLFIVIMIISTYLGSVIDGVDGLSGGVLTAIYTAFGAIALIRGSIDIATLCFTIVAGLLAFLWFNVPPARFMNGESGMTALLLSISVIAFLLNAIALLPIIGALLYITVGSSTLQILSKKFRHKKLFTIAPLHNYFSYIGCPPHLISMRYWIISYFLAIIGIILSIL